MNIPELDELYALYRADLYRYLCRLTRDSAAAEDLLSETFLRALKGAVTFRGESGVKTWLFTIARNAWCESLRRQHPTVSTDELVTAQYLADDTLHTHTETRALLHRVRELLDGYGDRPRDIVLLRTQGYSYANSSLCPWKNSHVALTFSNSVHFRVVTGSASKSYTRAPGMASKNGEWVAMTNWQL